MVILSVIAGLVFISVCVLALLPSAQSPHVDIIAGAMMRILRLTVAALVMIVLYERGVTDGLIELLGVLSK